MLKYHSPQLTHISWGASGGKGREKPKHGMSSPRPMEDTVVVSGKSRRQPTNPNRMSDALCKFFQGAQ
jgi:hypothetical protein